MGGGLLFIESSFIIIFSNNWNGQGILATSWRFAKHIEHIWETDKLIQQMLHTNNWKNAQKQFSFQDSVGGREVAGCVRNRPENNLGS